MALMDTAAKTTIGEPKVNLTESDQDLLDSAAQRLDRDAETLMQRYYGCPEDGRQELEEFNRTGKLQPSFAQLLRHELQVIQASAE
jgi:hypothetical protein